MTMTRSRPSRGSVLAACGFALGYGILRVYWAAGGRWGYTACDRADTLDAVQAATGCQASRLPTLPPTQGWIAVAASAALLTACLLAAWRPGRATSVPAGIGGAVLLAIAFPGHLLFELPAAAAGRVTDWWDLGHRLLQLGGGLLIVGLAIRTGSPRCPHPSEPVRTPSPVTGWTRGWSYAACAIPVLGFSLPHVLWLFGIGISTAAFDQIRADIGVSTMLGLAAGPALGGLASLGLGHGWGRTWWRWTPIAGRPIPRTLVLVPAGVIALSLVSYGMLGTGMVIQDLSNGALTWAQLGSQWMIVGTELVFLAWGIALGVAAAGYHRATRTHCRICPAD